MPERRWVVQTENRTFSCEGDSMPNISYCGLDCDICSYKTDNNCVTCRTGSGTVCYGRCDVALCVMERKLDVCSTCPEYPCGKFLAKRAY